MSKRRFQPLDVSATKKPRNETTTSASINASKNLRVSIGLETQQLANIAAEVSANLALKKTVTEPWDDEDDDFLDLCTQAEQQVLANHQFNNTYGGFNDSVANRANGTSTQMPPPTNVYEFDEFDSDTDLLLSQVNIFDVMAKKEEAHRRDRIDDFKFLTPQPKPGPSKEPQLPSQITVPDHVKLEMERRKVMDLQKTIDIIKDDLDKRNEELERLRRDLMNQIRKYDMKAETLMTVTTDMNKLRRENEQLKADKIRQTQQKSNVNSEALNIEKAMRSELMVKEREIQRLKAAQTQAGSSIMSILKNCRNFYQFATPNDWHVWMQRPQLPEIGTTAFELNPSEIHMPLAGFLNQLQTALYRYTNGEKLPLNVGLKLLRDFINVTSIAVNEFRKLQIYKRRDFDYPEIENHFLLRVMARDLQAFKSSKGNEDLTVYGSQRVLPDECFSTFRRCAALFSVLLLDRDICTALVQSDTTFFSNITHILRWINHLAKPWHCMGTFVALANGISSIVSHNFQLGPLRKNLVRTFQLLIGNSIANVEYITAMAEFLANVHDPGILKLLCKPTPGQVTVRGNQFRLKRRCCSLVGFAAKLRSLMLYSNQIELMKLVRLNIRVAQFLMVLRKFHVTWYERQLLVRDCDCLVRFQFALLLLQLKIVPQYIEQQLTESMLDEESIEANQEQLQAIQLSWTVIHDLITRLKYRESLWYTCESPNQFMMLLFQLRRYQNLLKIRSSTASLLEAMALEEENQNIYGCKSEEIITIDAKTFRRPSARRIINACAIRKEKK